MATPNLNITHIAVSQNNKETTANVAFDDLDNAMNASLDKAVTGDVVLTDAELREAFAIRLTGTLGSNFTLVIPDAISRFFAVINNTNRTCTIEVESAGSQGEDLLTAVSGVFYTDGAEIYSLGGGGAGGGGSSTFSMVVAASDEDTDLTTGLAKVTFRMPAAVTLTAVRASVNTAPVGDDIIVDINEGGVSILSTTIDIEAGETTSVDSAYEAVISDTALADNAEMTIDIDQIGSATAGKGLKVTLIGTYT